MVSWSWWRRSPNYEKELPKLAKEISQNQTRLIKATSTHRRWRAIAVLILFFSYAAALAYVFVISRPDPYMKAPYSDMWRYVHVFADPVLAYLLYATLTRTLAWRENSIRKHLNRLIARRQELLDAYKKKINFDQIQKIIGEPLESSNKPIDPSKSKTAPARNGGGKVHPSDGGPVTTGAAAAHAGDLPQKLITSSDRSTNPGGATTNNAPPASELNGHRDQANTGGQPWLNQEGADFRAVPVYHTSWVDRVMDLILGENEQSPTQRYALICPKCHAHNGLAPFGKSADEIAYLCPVCGTLNDPRGTVQSANASSQGSDRPNSEHGPNGEHGGPAGASNSVGGSGGSTSSVVGGANATATTTSISEPDPTELTNSSAQD